MLNNIVGLLAPQVAASTNSYESIQTVTVGAGGQSSISFTVIPSTYKHLQVRIFAQSNRGTYPLDDAIVRFNSDTGNNYTTHAVYGTGSAASAYASAPRSNIYGVGSLATSAGSGWTAGVFDILDYTNTSKYKTARWLQGFDTNGTVAGYGGYVDLISGLWMNTAAITSITFEVDGGRSYNQYSSFALYGIKG